MTAATILDSDMGFDSKIEPRRAIRGEDCTDGILAFGSVLCIHYDWLTLNPEEEWRLGFAFSSGG